MASMAIMLPALLEAKHVYFIRGEACLLQFFVTLSTFFFAPHSRSIFFFYLIYYYIYLFTYLLIYMYLFFLITFHSCITFHFRFTF